MITKGLEKMAGAGLTPLRKKIIDRSVRRANEGIKQLQNATGPVGANAFGALEYQVQRAMNLKKRLKEA